MRALYLRKGRIKDYVTTSVTRLKSPFYQVTVSNRNIHIRGLSGNETVQISQVAGCAVLVVKKVLSEEYSFRLFVREYILSGLLTVFPEKQPIK